MSEEKPTVIIKQQAGEWRNLRTQEKKHNFEIQATWTNGNEIHGYGDTMVEAVADALDSLEKAMLCLIEEQK